MPNDAAGLESVISIAGADGGLIYPNANHCTAVITALVVPCSEQGEESQEKNKSLAYSRESHRRLYVVSSACRQRTCEKNRAFLLLWECSMWHGIFLFVRQRGLSEIACRGCLVKYYEGSTSGQAQYRSSRGIYYYCVPVRMGWHACCMLQCH